MNQNEQERSRVDTEQLQERIEKSQSEIYKLKAKLEVSFNLTLIKMIINNFYLM
jgi:hypothetical protein